MRTVFISHAFSADVELNSRRVLAIARACVREGLLPLAPQIYFPQFIDESTERDLALRLCLSLVGLADEVRVYGRLSPGMIVEVEHARRLGIAVIDGRTGDEIPNNGEPPR